MTEGSLKVVSFDVWDTLLSVRAFYLDVATELSKLLGVHQTLMENKLLEGYTQVRAVRRAGGFSDFEIVPASLKLIAKLLNVETGTVEKAILNAVENSRPERYMLDGVPETLNFIKSLGLTVIVVGNVVFWPGNINRILLEKTGLAKFMDEQFYADEIGVSKPKPEAFTKALSKFDVKPHEAVHVGDSLFEDLAGAVLAQMRAVLIDKNVNSIVKLSSWDAYIIPDIKRLGEVIQNWEKH
ncbi:MAG: HAD family hydrolase [Candidatus Bathyarchaeia archaeon]